MTAGKDRTGGGQLVTQPTSLSLERHPTSTTKTDKKQQPKGPPRGGLKDGPNRTDYTATTATETDYENTRASGKDPPKVCMDGRKLPRTEASESTRGKPSVARMANSNLALQQRVRQEGPKARTKTTEPMDSSLLEA